MAPRLRDSYGPQVPARVADMVAGVLPGFDREAFIARALTGYGDLELMQRARAVADALAVHLPGDPCVAIDTLTRALPDRETAAHWHGMEPFVLLPFGMYIADHGLDCFEPAMAAQYEITRRFTSEFSIRAFIERRYAPTMDRLRLWATDADEHVRRLVSEGTRPRLPWAPRLECFRADPHPVLELLELLKDDPSDYVRRSVANNLNDIAKDHPELVVEVCRRWWADGEDNRRRLIRRALRTLVKQGDPAAMAVLGYSADTPLRIRAADVVPPQPRIGSSVRLSVEVVNPTAADHPAIVDFAVDFVKAAGRRGKKVFTGREVVVPGGGSVTVAKSVSLAQHTTRTHYAGDHTVAVLLNGVSHEVGRFRVIG